MDDVTDRLTMAKSRIEEAMEMASQTVGNPMPEAMDVDSNPVSNDNTE